MSKPATLFKKILTFSLIFASISCAQGKLDPVDRQTGLRRSEISDTLIRNRKDEAKEKELSNKNEAPIPKTSKLIITPPPPSIGGEKTISFSVTDQIPLKDVLIELGRMAKIDVDIDPSISGGIILNAKNRPLKEVIDRISSLGGLRYSYQNDVLHFEADKPYMKNYFVDYLTDGTLWTDVEANINAIFAADGGGSSSSSSAPASGGGEDSSFQSFGSSGGSGSSTASSLSSNKSAGIISIFATEKQHRAVESYLADVEKAASAQVIIEAKVVEVSLADTYKTGINWSSVGKKNNLVSTNGYTSGSALSYVATELFNSDLTASISALETFGTTKTISSPRVHAMNNQKATLNFADKLVYFKVEKTQTVGAGASFSGTASQTTNSTKQEENIGVSLTITPSINVATNEIIMSINPKLSVQSGEAIDPVNADNKIPIIQTREINTIAKIQNGNVLVIGGLMKEKSTNSDSGIPFLSRIPVLGWFFKSVSKDSTVIETVIFIKATIVNSRSAVNPIDRDIQKKFDLNRRKYISN